MSPLYVPTPYFIPSPIFLIPNTLHFVSDEQACKTDHNVQGTEEIAGTVLFSFSLFFISPLFFLKNFPL